MLFYADSIVLAYTDIDTAKQWWIGAFDCKPVKVPSDWDNTLPSDVALMLPGLDQPTILLTSRAETEESGLLSSEPVVSTMFSGNLRKAHDKLSQRGILLGPIQENGDMKTFELRDLEGNLIQICEE